MKAKVLHHFTGIAGDPTQKPPLTYHERAEETAEVFEDLNADVEKYIFEGSQHSIVD